MRPITAFALLACVSLSGCIGSGFTEERLAWQRAQQRSPQGNQTAAAGGMNYYENISGRGQWNGGTYVDGAGNNYDRTQTHPSYPAAMPPPQR